MPTHRPDETYHRLLFWTYGQALSERLAGHLLYAEGYRSIDPSHPLGGPDQGADALCLRNGKKWVMACYFPYGPFDSLTEVERKLEADVEAARHREPHGVAFVTNQKLTNGERRALQSIGGAEIEIDIFHLERNVHLLDGPGMAQIREQYVYIPATGLPPMDVKAWVVGSAHMFTDDEEVFDRFVQMHEEPIRKRSDEGHARVRAEREAKERERQEKLAREAASARDAAIKARQDPRRVGMPPGPGWPLPAGFSALADISRMSEHIGVNALFESAAWKSVVAKPPEPVVPYKLLGLDPPAPQEPPEPLSEEQIQEQVDEYRTELDARWPACRDYLAGVAWPALRLRIKNQAESFLTDVEVILTFHGARGIDFDHLELFEFEKVENPDWVKPMHPLAYGVIGPVTPKLAPPADYPLDWGHNDDGDLEVTVNLARLRPHPEWRSEAHCGEDIVLVVDPDVDVDEITVTYTVTAQGYGREYVGDPFTVPVEKVDMLTVLRDTLKASDELS